MHLVKSSVFSCILLFVLVSVGPLTAQETNAPGSPQIPQNFWKAVTPMGAFVVAHGAIASVSMHEYIVQGVGRVTEMDIAMTSSAIARFYYIEALTPQSPGGIGQSVVNTAKEKFEEVLSRADSEENLEQVQKTYPATTHAHTIEYRVKDLKSLQKLFQSVQKSWFTGQGETCVIK